MVSGQLLIVNFGGEALSTEPLNATQWGISLGLGALSLIVAIIVRLIPDEFIRNVIYKIFPQTHAKCTKIDTLPRFKWNDTIENVRDELGFFKSVRGRHWNGFFTSKELDMRTPLLSPTEDVNSSYTDGPGENIDALYARSSPIRSRSASVVASAAVMAGVIAGSVAGWNPTELTSEEDDS
jgi:Ca2+-transporting ATPase